MRGFEQAADWAANHHEHLDGSGYCKGLDHGELDLGAKIVAVADETRHLERYASGA